MRTHASSSSILVPERGTRSICYPGVGTWHSDPHILSWYRNVAPDPYSILVSEHDTPILIYYPGTRTWHPIYILSWCQNVTLWSSYTILVPERGTQSIFYPGVGTWHSDPHILSWYRNVAPDPYTILVSERDTRSSYTILIPERGTRSPNLTTFVHQAFLYTKASSLTSRLGFLFQDLGFNSFIMLILSQSYNHIHASIQLSI